MSETQEKKEVQDKKGLVDVAVEKLTSRKLLVFIIATTLLIMGDLNADLWSYLAMIYVGSQAAADIFAKVKGA